MTNLNTPAGSGNSKNSSYAFRPCVLVARLIVQKAAQGLDEDELLVAIDRAFPDLNFHTFVGAWAMLAGAIGAWPNPAMIAACADDLQVRLDGMARW